MSNHNYPRRLLDDAIDRAVQELVYAEPRPGFRRRVLERLNAPPARMSWIPRLLVPAGVVVAVVMLAVLLKPAPPTSVTEPVAVTQAPAASAPVVNTAPAPAVSVERSPSKITPRSAPVTFSFGPPTDRVSATSVADPAAILSIAETGDEPAPAQRDVTSRIAPIAIPSITIRPIEVKEIK